MLPKSRRISRRLFPEGSRTGKVFHAPHVSLRVTPGRTTGARVGVVVSKKIAPRSVDRHLMKRRVYEMVEHEEKTSPLPKRPYVFFAKKDACTLPFGELRAEITKLLQEARTMIVNDTRVV